MSNIFIICLEKQKELQRQDLADKNFKKNSWMTMNGAKQKELQRQDLADKDFEKILG